MFSFWKVAPGEQSPLCRFPIGQSYRKWAQIPHIDTVISYHKSRLNSTHNLSEIQKITCSSSLIALRFQPGQNCRRAYLSFSS